MPATYWIDVARRLVLSRGWGVFTEQDLLGHFTTLAADPAFQSTFSQLADLRSVERAELSKPSSQSAHVFRDIHDAEEWLGLETPIVTTTTEE